MGVSPVAASNSSPTHLADFHFFTLGIQYYVAGRQAALAGLMPITGNLFHHSVEMLLKGQLAKRLPLKTIKDSYNHNLKKAWADFKAMFPQEGLTAC
jgi:hypothetical protein